MPQEIFWYILKWRRYNTGWPKK